MENEKKIEKLEVKDGGIDQDVLDLMVNEDVLGALEDDKQIKRVVLNCFCEFLAELKKVSKSVDDFMETISICSSKKIREFFAEVKDNTQKEVTRVNVAKKVAKSHQKSKKSTKSVAKVVKFSPNSVK